MPKDEDVLQLVSVSMRFFTKFSPSVTHPPSTPHKASQVFTADQDSPVTVEECRNSVTMTHKTLPCV